MQLDEKAQVSIELIVVLFVVCAIAILIFSQLKDTAKTSAGKMDSKVKEVFKKFD